MILHSPKTIGEMTACDPLGHNLMKHIPMIDSSKMYQGRGV